MSSGPALEIELEREGAPPLRLRWDLESLGLLGTPAAGLGAAPPWRADADLDLGSDVLRVISATLEDGTALGLGGLRPTGSPGHDSERIRAAIFRPGFEPAAVEDVLVSTEYDAAGRVHRLALEIYEDPEGPPSRLAADVRELRTDERDGWRREAAAIVLRMNGVAGTGLHERLTAPTGS